MSFQECKRELSPAAMICAKVNGFEIEKLSDILRYLDDRIYKELMKNIGQ
jgi:hypothetical protein